jgi:hypothetical protein
MPGLTRHPSACTCRECRVTRDIARLNRDKEQLAQMKAQRETATGDERCWLDEDCAAMADKIRRLQVWIEGGVA